MGSLLVILIFATVLISLRAYKRFWIIFIVLLNKCWFPILTVFFTALIFGGTPQGRDLISQVEFGSKVSRNLSSLIALWFWTFNCWKMSSTVLDLLGTHNLSGKKERLARSISFWIPLVIGLLPFLFALIIFIRNQPKLDPVFLIALALESWLYIVFVLLKSDHKPSAGVLAISEKRLHLLSFYLFYFYSILSRGINSTFDKILNRASELQAQSRPDKFDYKEHWRMNFTGERFLSWSGHTLLYVFIALYPNSFGKIIGPFGLVFFALSWFVILGTGFIYLRKMTKQPMFKFMLLSIAIFTCVNDNNLSGILDFTKKDERENINAHFQNWVMAKKPLNDTLNITLVAAEGGGLRSAYWIYAVLRQLQLDNPNFKDDLFAISGVSGGSVGAAIFCSELGAGLSQNLEDAPIINEDNLSPMIAGLLYRELAQSALPFPVVGLDRSRIMDQTFVLNWEKKHANDQTWENGFLDLWKGKPGIPALLLNAMQVETGKSAVFSNLQFDSTQIQALDMVGILKSKMTLSTTAGISSRFPLFQPVAKFDYENGKTWGHLADGGYADNSGISTIFQVYINLRKTCDAWIKNNTIKPVKFSILFITNVIDSADPPPTFLNELKSPLNAIASSWRTRGNSFERIAFQTLPMFNQTDRYFEVHLNRENATLPLGWYFSNSSRRDIIQQANDLHINDDYMGHYRFMYH